MPPNRFFALADGPFNMDLSDLCLIGFSERPQVRSPLTLLYAYNLFFFCSPRPSRGRGVDRKDEVVAPTGGLPAVVLKPLGGPPQVPLFRLSSPLSCFPWFFY